MYLDTTYPAAHKAIIYDDDEDPPVRLGLVVAIDTDEKWILQYDTDPKTGKIQTVNVEGVMLGKVYKKFGHFRIEFR